MNIYDKIEEIRHESEHVRLRWVWGLTAGSMLVIFIVWIILIKSQFSQLSSSFPSSDSDISTEFDQQKKSIKDAVSQAKGVLNKSDSGNSNDIPSSENVPDKENIVSSGNDSVSPSASTEGFGPASGSNTDSISANSVSNSN